MQEGEVQEGQCAGEGGAGGEGAIRRGTVHGSQDTGAATCTLSSSP